MPPLRLEIDVTPAAEVLGEPVRIAANVLLPADNARPRALLTCLPGGAMNRRYFDLPTPGGQAEASFARALAARGFAVAWMDPLGIGESTIPKDPYLLEPDLMARTNGVAAEFILHGLRKGTLSSAWPALPDLVSIGVAHSYGALLTIIQEAAKPMHAALGFFGFHIGGLPEYVTPEEAALDPAYIRANIVAMTRAKHPEPYYMVQGGKPSKQPVSTEVAVQELLVTMTLFSRLPNMVAKDAAEITAPLFLAFADKDMHPAHIAPTAYPKSSDITLVVLPNTRHNHFIYPSRTYLFDRFAQWANQMLALAGTRPAPAK